MLITSVPAGIMGNVCVAASCKHKMGLSCELIGSLDGAGPSVTDMSWPRARRGPSCLRMDPSERGERGREAHLWSSLQLHPPSGLSCCCRCVWAASAAETAISPACFSGLLPADYASLLLWLDLSSQTQQGPLCWVQSRRCTTFLQAPGCRS